MKRLGIVVVLLFGLEFSIPLSAASQEPSMMSRRGRLSPNRQAVELVKYHIGWKHALAQELEGEVFDPTVLVRFRERLVEHAQGQVAFEAVLGRAEAGGAGQAERQAAAGLDARAGGGVVDGQVVRYKVCKAG